MITEQDVIDAYDKLENAFNTLAFIEDETGPKVQELAETLKDYKEGTKTYQAAQKKIKTLQVNLLDAQRKYRLCAMKVDCIRMLVEVQGLAAGK